MVSFEELTAHIQERVNNKSFDNESKRNISEDWLGNLSGTRMYVNGQTRGSTVTKIDDGARVELELAWEYKRREYRGVLPAITENRSDKGTYTFDVRLNPLYGGVVSEVSRTCTDPTDVSHDSPKNSFAGLIQDVIKPNFKVQ